MLIVGSLSDFTSGLFGKIGVLSIMIENSDFFFEESLWTLLLSNSMDALPVSASGNLTILVCDGPIKLTLAASVFNSSNKFSIFKSNFSNLLANW